MNLSLGVRLWVLPSLLAGALVASAQTAIPGTSSDSPSSPPSPGPPPIAHVSHVDGTAQIDQEGQADDLTAGVPLLPGDRLRTERGRVEVLFADGSALHLDEYTTADILAADLIRLIGGRVFLLAAGSREPTRAVRYQIDAPAASLQANWPGQYRVATSSGDVEAHVVTGDATFATDQGAVTLRAGERSIAAGGRAPSAPEYFNSARWDDFDRWSASRRGEWAGSASADYIPREIGAYAGTFDRYGTWRQEPSVGYVWYPTVADDWRPYSYGYWRPYDSWGSVWIDLNPWGWATHHYGRWGFSLNWGWYWIPSRVWGPGWVYWSTAPGYVSWCALGFHDGPVFGLWGLRGGYYGRHVDPWRGWTVVARHDFGRRSDVRRVAIDGRRLHDRERGSFVAQRRAPHVAVPRSTLAGNGRGNAPRPSGLGSTPGGLSLGSPGARGDNRPGTARFGRGDGTGLTAPPVRVDRGDADGDARARRRVPGSPVVSYGDSRESGWQRPGAAAPGDSARTRTRPGLADVAPRDAVEPGPRSLGSPRFTIPPRNPDAGGGRRESFPRAEPRDDRRVTPGASGIPQDDGWSRGRSGPRGATPGASGLPEDGGGRRGRSSTPAEPTPGASGLPRRAPQSGYTPRGGNERPRGSSTPRSYEAPRSYESPRSSEAPRSYESRRSSEAPRSYESPRSSEAPRSYGTPRGGESRRGPSGGSSSMTGGSSAGPRSAPRGSDSGRSYSPRSGSSGSSGDSRRSGYNSGSGGSRGGARSSAPARRR